MKSKEVKKSKEVIQNNVVTFVGEMMGNYEFDHEVEGEGFYRTKVRSYRLSDKFDDIVVIFSDRLVDVNEDPTGAYVKIDGQFRSFNQHEEGKSTVKLFLFAKDVEQLGSIMEVDEKEHNNAVLIGTVCKKPNYRKTPLGKEICDILLAVNRPYGRSDYIPSIAWNKTAQNMQHLEVGDKVKCIGRLQSREYDKKIDETRIEKRTAYEYSIREYEFLEAAEAVKEGA